jgi:hypothetical protein
LSVAGTGAGPLTILNVYRLIGSAGDFREAIGRLADRVEREGHPGVRGCRFFVNDVDAVARAVIDYEGPDAWLGHHEIAMGWPEMAALHGVATLSEVTFRGPLTPEIEAWIASSSLTARISGGYGIASGFQR